MKGRLWTLLVCFVLHPLVLLPSLQAQSTAFTYQGRLLDGGQPATGSYDLQFRLTDALSGGNPIGAALTNAPVLVTNGLFLVLLDFGSGAFDGSPRWLEVGVRTNGSASPYFVLSPRQAITASPYATFASTAASASVAAGLVPGAAITANGAGITNLNGAFIQAGTINSNQLDQATADQIALAGTLSGSTSNAIASLGGNGTNTALYYPTLVAGTNSIAASYALYPGSNLVVSGCVTNPLANGVYVPNGASYLDPASGDTIVSYAGPHCGILFDLEDGDGTGLRGHALEITNGTTRLEYLVSFSSWCAGPWILVTGGYDNYAGSKVCWSTNSVPAGFGVAGGLMTGSFSGTFSGSLAASSNYSAGRLVGTVTVPVASDLSASSNYNANRLVGTIPLANLPSQVLSNTGMTSGIPVSAIQPLGSFSLASVAPTPPMGICTWPLYNGGNQGLVQMFTDMLSTNGLVGYGWKVIQLDAGWQLPSRDSHENLVPDPARYTNWTGMLSYMQTKGVALGLYTEMTSCGGNVPTLDGYYAQDVAQFASWGVSYLKVDCGDLGDQRYVQFSDLQAAMEQAGLSAYVINGGLNPPAGFPVRAWLPAVVNAWRLGMDGDSYLFGGKAVAQGNMLLHFHHALEYGAAFTGPGHYPDMDFINTGQADYGDYVNTSTSPYRYPTIESDIGLAAMCPSPIMVDTVNLALMPIYTNTAMIAIDQDPLVMPAQVVSSNATSEVWSRRLFNGDRAVALINKTGSSQAISVNLSALGLPAGPTAVYSVWDQAYLPCAPAAFTSSVDPLYVQLLRFSPTQAGLFTGTVGLTSNSVPYTLHITNGLIYGVTSP